METVTLAELRAAARLYADERQAGYVTDASNSIDVFINNAARTIRRLVLSYPGGRSFWSLRETFALVGAQAAYRIDGTNSTNGTDYQVESLGEVTLDWGSNQPERVDPMPDAEWERINSGAWGQNATKCYRQAATYTGTVWGQTIVFAPTPTAAVTASVEYIPSFTKLVNSTDAITGPEGIGEAISLMTAIQLKGMQNEQAQYLQTQLQGVQEMMRTSIMNRQANFGPRVMDAHPDDRLWALRDRWPWLT